MQEYSLSIQDHALVFTPHEGLRGNKKAGAVGAGSTRGIRRVAAFPLIKNCVHVNSGTASKKGTRDCNNKWSE